MYTFHRNGRASRRPAHPEDRTGAGAQGPVTDGQQVTAEERERANQSRSPPLSSPAGERPPFVGWERRRSSASICLHSPSPGMPMVSLQTCGFVCMLCKFDRTVSAFSSITLHPHSSSNSQYRCSQLCAWQHIRTFIPIL